MIKLEKLSRAGLAERVARLIETGYLDSILFKEERCFIRCDKKSCAIYVDMVKEGEDGCLEE